LTIALVILHADRARGGAEQYTVDLAAALATRGHEVSILAADSAAPVPGAKFVQLANDAITRRGRYRRFLDSLDEHLITRRYDIVHAMLPVRQCDVYHPHAGLAAETMEKWHSHFDPRRRLFARVERGLLSSDHPPVVLCLSEYVKQTIRRHYQLPDDRLATLFNAVDLSRFDPGEPPRHGDRVIALMVAQDFERKGLKQAIAAIIALGDPKLELCVVGKDDPAPYRGLSPQVKFVGPVLDPVPYYRAADFFLLPTRHDPGSLATLEALAMGLPVISTRFNGACEIMQDGVHGVILSDPNDVPAIVTAIRRVRAGSMRQACLDLRPRLSFDSHLDTLLAIYDSCRSLSQKSTAR